LFRGGVSVEGCGGFVGLVGGVCREVCVRYTYVLIYITYTHVFIYIYTLYMCIHICGVWRFCRARGWCLQGGLREVGFSVSV